jgi:hypothetical protein
VLLTNVRKEQNVNLLARLDSLASRAARARHDATVPT